MNVLTMGSFDIIHGGHVSFLNACKLLTGGDTLYVGLNSDEFITSYKGRPPVVPFWHRSAVIHAITGQPVLENSSSGIELIERTRRTNLGIKVIAVGSDWHGKDYLKQIGTDWDRLTELGISLCYIPYTPGISTTQLRAGMFQA